ncbi:anthranilate synthase component I [Desertibacillus haloalkaliphilus]|uniref:anthranilate synthase component I n=1 Tax=Desertibacillus haloalkaliphilus TaxID=1328930 RepID=UPI001C2649C4|nr:anthranilate synthase component I [Desertibacillus haloalkaliphilus]MBU8907249.1 anthranilate synthase component I [Desertibacillus haloalkaliphilus]
MNETTLSTFLEDSQIYHTIPIVRHFFADTLTPIQIFRQLENDAAFLLESKDEQSPWSRFSFIGLNPFLSLEEEDGVYELKTKKRESVLTEASFQAAFDATLDYLKVKPIDTPIPFKGGAVGYIAYDAIREIEPVLQQNKKHETNKFHFLFCETIIAYDHIKKELFIVYHARTTSDHDQNKEVYQRATRDIEAIVEKLTVSTQESKLFSPPKVVEDVDFSNVKSNYERQQFLDDVNKIKDYIRAGDVFQTVLSQRFELDVSVSGLDVYRVLRMINPSPYLFYLKIGGQEIVGSSPERLVQIQEGHVEIHPIAGTRKRGRTAEEDDRLAQELLADEKERAEHYMLVDLARNDVGRVSTYGSVDTPVLMEIGRFSHVMHIISKVTGKLGEHVHPIEALMSSFPAGTVSGAPKIRAMEILQEIEPTDRNVYAGAIGYLGYDGNVDSCIAIRTMVIKDQKAYVQAGAGVVADSVPEMEWEETRNKAKALIKAIQVAEDMFAEEAIRHG